MKGTPPVVKFIEPKPGIGKYPVAFSIRIEGVIVSQKLFVSIGFLVNSCLMKVGLYPFMKE
jgi:hypothetical protein